MDGPRLGFGDQGVCKDVEQDCGFRGEGEQGLAERRR